MSRPDEYIDTAELVRTNYYQLHAVKHKTAGTPYLLKKFFRLDGQQMAGLRSSIELAKELKLEILLEPIEFFEQGVQASVLYKHFPAISLRFFLQQHKRLLPADFILIAKNIATLIGEFHARGWIIKNLNPENILLDADNLACKLGDLRKATRIFKKERNLVHQKTDFLELQYISPEQTGRIAQQTDQRADLYALGIIFYELLTGIPPFSFTDPVEIIHAHLAVPAKEPISIKKDIPYVLNDIVLKLISKNPEDRYQSCEGLLNDLGLASDAISRNEKIKLGTKDKITKIIPTSRLIGRAGELNTLEQLYKKAIIGNKQVVYISGYSGVGKTRIVQEFYRSKVSERVPMVRAKFDTMQRHIPYSALLIAMRELIRKLNLEPDEDLVYWKSRLLSGLNNNGGIITEVIPELELLIGTQEALNPLPPEEAQKRFQQTFIRFITCFTSGDHSLILFLDDLQWADIASIQLIELILMDDTIKNFLFIGAFRDNEVEPTHPLMQSLKRQEQWIRYESIRIPELDKNDTTTLIRETLHFPLDKAEEFGEKMFLKTGGNTFFTIQLLTSLFEDKLLIRNDEGAWVWDEKIFQDMGISANVVDFLVDKMENLDYGLKSLLRIASALGDVFDLKTLAQIAEKKQNEVALELSAAVNMGYIISLDENLDAFFRTIRDIGEKDLEALGNTRFRFSHDRIRQAVLVLVGEKDLAALNLAAARIKIARIRENETDEEIFQLANHFNVAASLVNSPEEKQLLVKYNHLAGIKARNASAYEAAIRYFDVARQHLSFDNDYEKCFDVQLQQAECRYLTGKYEVAEKDLDDLYKVCRTRIDKLNTLFIKVYLYNIQDRKKEAIDAGRIGYRLFDIHMPSGKAATMALLLKDVMTARIKVKESEIPLLLGRPLMKDAEKIRLQEFLLAMAPTMYQYDQNLFAWNFMRMFFNSLNEGNNGISSFCYIGYGMLVSQLFGKYHMGKKLADVALQLNNQLGYTALKWKVRLSYYNFVHHWTEPVRPEIDNILEIENGAFANGDPIFAGYAVFIYHQKIFALGFPLAEVNESFENYLRQVDQRRDLETRHFLEGYHFPVRCLLGIETNILHPSGIDPKQLIAESIASSSFTVAADASIGYMLTLHLFGYRQEASDCYQQGSKYMAFIQQRYEFAEFHFYGALICASAYENKLSFRGNPLSQLRKHVQKLKAWTRNCAANFEPQYLIASAELARVSGRDFEAMGLFEKAIESAEQYRFINYKALANELAGYHQLKSGNKNIAYAYLDHARKDWMAWGAVAKVKDIEQKNPDLFNQSISQAATETEIRESAFTGMDLNLLLKATHAINIEKDIDGLVEQLMKTIIQYSGADTGHLLVRSGNDLIIKSRYSISKGIETIDLPADNDLLPMSIIRYVVRLIEPLIVNDPALSSDYSRTSYFETHQPKSLMAYPIIKQGEIFGVLYLENFQHQHVFDEQKINILSVISAQVAVSLESALLYQQLESRVLERTEAIELEKGKVDEMLENMLPKDSIEELKRTGKTTAQKLDNITVMFADIKGFTKIAERLSPEELINKIDYYFSYFDELMVKNRLEKIKTIGDAYVAIGGLNVDAGEGALDMIKAAMQMQDFLQKQNKGLPESEWLEMRIGIHTGPVIAGVVGFKKFQYDIWGDTVNIAARMEQESEPAKINISNATYELVRENTECNYRGKIDAKNKGLLDMYFVEHLR
ncbi:adenylate/guanylate cyclase domain-containing protein [Pollutibacter soli]|uniref:adenylate/guanylate cyclase domain-containing protein n=1 Tax=Pollutibacter soli TaxID=3034157 RepID=UPI003013ECE3